jgi:cellobiose phosphorylase
MQRTYRGADYDITIEKPKGLCQGPIELLLDGQKLPGNVIAPQGDGKKHKVQVLMRQPGPNPG